MLTNSQKSSLKNVLQSPHWRVVEYLANEYIRMLEGNSTMRDSDWETLRETILKEGKIQGIRDFIQEIYNNTQ